MENKEAARKKKTYGSFKSGNMEILKHRELIVAYFACRKSSCWFLNAAQLCQKQVLKTSSRNTRAIVQKQVP